MAGELEAERATGLSVERKLCALRFFATGSKRRREQGDDRVSQSTGSECVRRVAEAVVNSGVRNKCDHFPKTSEEKAAVKEGFLRRGAIPGVIGCTDGSLIAIIAPKGDRKGYYAENFMFICDADMRILTVYPMRPGSDHDSFVRRTTWLRRRFQAGRIANPGVYLIVVNLPLVKAVLSAPFPFSCKWQRLPLGSVAPDPSSRPSSDTK
ncbi:hypothetical protein HPB49_005133 [Dermacentor silvarum]|uniref:Uncharacterized protein n=1 Tax=Dermacentor silvarum TaxID=543639 RepID=A0ACB8DV67_DERSI|nr:putative nuclease HARBI1 [Dermacentor silvarum]KAH7978295.1 hypothetical protein HPB49_005133 [Dermacentor silvarum]